MRRVAITGLGAVSPAGLTAATTWQRVVAGETAIGPLRLPRMEDVGCPVAAQAHAFDPDAHFSAKRQTSLDRVSQFAVVAAREAVADAGFLPEDPGLAKADVVIGIGVGGMNTLDDSFHRIYGERGRGVHPLTIPKLMTNAPASQISMDLGLRGNTFAVASACASGSHAIGLAFRAILHGDCDIALAGGSEACITNGTLVGWSALRILSRDTCRPFARNRNGLVLGEGSAILVLEEWERAVARNARIYAELVGFGANADAGDLTSPDQSGAEAAMQRAMASAGLAPSAIDYVNAHGTGTLMNDIVESRAIRAVFPADDLPLVSSIKGVLGHCLGAAGALEALATTLTLYHQLVPPTANCAEPDEECGLDVVAEGARPASVRHALSNSFAFGGLNAVLAFSAWKPIPSAASPAM
ncbi:beta-ACP synthase [Bosea thiooxidans]|uniref:Nodulation protein E n=1 Tax=Bosea thiooxidans TaxID=53254 RepID=A0A0Q3IAK3_9HYPH|nr:beta-ketoacyl-[acyl-carrier-protein] synthase family protein [Bosea thiooxidans]KQK32007.1 beta-ACP synthase [Bosea thiooxidans]SKB36315.1 nodulation protein E [Bosea thiooxidans]